MPATGADRRDRHAIALWDLDEWVTMLASYNRFLD